MPSLRALFAACGFAFAAVLASAAFAQSPPAGTIIVIDDVTLIDVENSRAIPHQTVTIAGERIERIDESTKAQIPEGAKIIAGKGLYLIPGLFDAHVHLTPSVETFAPMLLANGVTAVRDTGADTATIIDLRTQSHEPGSDLPWIICTGAIVDGDPPVWPFSEPCDTPDEARAAVRKLHEAGVDMIKVYSRLEPEVYRAAIEQAHALGIKATGHVPSAISLAEALAARQDCAEHLMGLDKLMVELSGQPDDSRQTIWPGLSGWLRLPDIDKTKLREALRPLAQAGMTQCPTLVVMRGMGAAADPATADKDERMAYVPTTLRGFWGGGSYGEFGKLAAALMPHMQTMVGELHRAGVPLMIGTDLANPYVFAGFSVHDEMKLFEGAGIPPIDVLRSATIIPARFCGVDDELGSVAPGKLASMVLLRSDPTADIDAVSAIQGVFVRGRHLDRAALDKMLTSVREFVSSAAPAQPAQGVDMNLAGELVARGRYVMKFNGQFDAGTEDFVITRDKAGYHVRANSQPMGGIQPPALVDFHVDSDFKFISARLQQLTAKPIVAEYSMNGDALLATPISGAGDAQPFEFKVPENGVVGAPVSACDFTLFGTLRDLKVDETRTLQAVSFGFGGWRIAAAHYAVTFRGESDFVMPDGATVKARHYVTKMSAQGMEINGETWIDERGVMLKSVLRAQFGMIETALASLEK